MNRVDPNGRFYLELLDFVFAGLSIGEFLSNPSWNTAYDAVWDLLSLSPVIPSSGVLNILDEGYDLIKYAGKSDIFSSGAKYIDDARISPDSFVWKPTTIEGGVCFVAGTLVNTESGLIPIEQIKQNDYVWAWNEETGEVELKKVVQTFINETDELIHVFVNGEEIITTPEHPFYSPIKGWTSAVHLHAGDILVLVNGNYVVVDKIQHELLESPITVYNFEVEDNHTYYVGDAGVLVHNACGVQPNLKNSGDLRALKELSKEYAEKGVTNNESSILLEWANEYGVLNKHGPQIHEGKNGYWSNKVHIKLFNYHIEIID